MINKLSLPKGYVLKLNETEYTIVRRIGHGGSSIVYSATSKTRGPVVIKELLPDDLKDKITRKDYDGGDMCLIIPEDCNDLMAMYTDRAELEVKLLHDMRTKIKKDKRGNPINITADAWFASYEKPIFSNTNNSLYTVISATDGETLQSMMSLRNRYKNYKSFTDICEQILRILEALNPMHEHPDGAYLHLDIAPDNIWVLALEVDGKRIANLIDFNSAYKMNTIEEKDRLFSRKEPYSAPELQKLTGTTDPEALKLKKSVDLYSVVVIFFELLMGRSPSGNDQLLWTSDTNIVLLNNDPDTREYIKGLFSRTVKKLNKVLKKGLAHDPDDRYENIDELWSDIRLLIKDAEIKKKYMLRLEKQLETISAQKESNAKIYELLYDNDAYIPMMAKNTDSEALYNLDELLFQLEADGYRHAVLTGDGGMGKTTTSLRILESCLNRHEQAVYIPLRDYSPLRLKKEKESPTRRLEDRIKDAFGIIGNNNTALTYNDYIDLITEDEIVLILDGFNEISDVEGFDDDDNPAKRTKFENELSLLKELEELAKKDYIRIIITSRGSISHRSPLNLDSFAKIEFVIITQDYIAKWLSAHLPENNIEAEKANLPFDVLGVPMLLKMYAIDIAAQRSLNEKAKQGFLDTPNTAGEILWNYFEHQTRKSITLFDKSEDLKGFSSILFKHVLPYIGYRFENQEVEKELFTFDDVIEYIEVFESEIKVNYKRHKLRHSALQAFLDNPDREMELIEDICANRFGIIKQHSHEGGPYSFAHQYFRDFFSAVHIRNQMILNDKKVFTERIFPFHISRMLLEILQEHKYVPPRG